jgi:hypothetical protein
MGTVVYVHPHPIMLLSPALSLNSLHCLVLVVIGHLGPVLLRCSILGCRPEYLLALAQGPQILPGHSRDISVPLCGLEQGLTSPAGCTSSTLVSEDRTCLCALGCLDAVTLHICFWQTDSIRLFLCT